MTQTQLRNEIKKSVDQLPEDRLTSLADYIAFLSRPDLRTRLEQAEQDIKAKRGVNWRKVRDDV